MNTLEKIVEGAKSVLYPLIDIPWYILNKIPIRYLQKQQPNQFAYEKKLGLYLSPEQKFEEFLDKIPKGVELAVIDYDTKLNGSLIDIQQKVNIVYGKSDVVFHPTYQIEQNGNAAIYVASQDRYISEDENAIVSYFSGGLVNKDGRVIPLAGFVHYARNKTLEDLVKKYANLDNTKVYETKRVALVNHNNPEFLHASLSLATELAEAGQGVTATETRIYGIKDNIYLNYHKIVELAHGIESTLNLSPEKTLPYLVAQTLGHEALHALASKLYSKEIERDLSSRLAVEEGLAEISGLLFVHSMYLSGGNSNRLSEKEFYRLMGALTKEFAYSLMKYYPKAYNARNPYIYYEVGNVLIQLGENIEALANLNNIDKKEHFNMLLNKYVNALTDIARKYGLNFNPSMVYAQLNPKVFESLPYATNRVFNLPLASKGVQYSQNPITLSHKYMPKLEQVSLIKY